MKKFLLALALVGLVDSISFMVVAPSLVFYVMQHGGTKEQYGLILSSFSFASFLSKPFLGAFSDSIGFRPTYFVSLLLSSIGGLIYFGASAYDNTAAIVLMTIGRILGGVGAGSSTLGFAYIARVVPHDEQTKVNSVLSMVRSVGMAAGPGLNFFLGMIDTTLFGFRIDPYNSCGLVLLASNLLAMLTIHTLLDEPAPASASVRSQRSTPYKTETSTSSSSSSSSSSTVWIVSKAMISWKLLIPVFSLFVLNANFQLIETGFTPSVKHALGWGPFEASAVMGIMAIEIFALMFVVFELSSHKVKDEHIIIFGHLLSALGYFFVWDLWALGSPPWHFYVPMILATGSFPFLGATTRSCFTKACDEREELDGMQGTMQSILGMVASVAGFTAPGLIAAYVLRSPEEVEASSDQRELSPGALFAPLFSLLCLAGVIYLHSRPEDVVDIASMARQWEVDAETEQTPLMNAAGPNKEEDFSSSVVMHRRSSASVMGMAQGSLHHEHHQERRMSSIHA